MLTGLKFEENTHKGFLSSIPINIYNLPCLLLFEVIND